MISWVGERTNEGAGMVRGMGFGSGYVSDEDDDDGGAGLLCVGLFWGRDLLG